MMGRTLIEKTDGKSLFKGTTRVVIIPKTVMDKEFSIWKVQHPRHESVVIQVLSNGSKIYELLSNKDDLRSWFVDDSVISDGNVYFATELDPLFLVLPLIKKSQISFSPIDQYIASDDSGSTELHKCLENLAKEDQLRNICDVKIVSDLTLYRYSVNKTSDWIEAKIKSVAEAITKNSEVKLSSNLASVVSTYVATSSDNTRTEENILAHSCEIVCEYLPEDLTALLYNKYLIERDYDTVKTRGTESTEPVVKRAKLSEGPDDDFYDKNRICNTKAKSKLTVSQKSLAKVDKKGMKTMQSFFKKQ